MEKYAKDELYSDKYKPADFVWGQSLGEGKFWQHNFKSIAQCGFILHNCNQIYWLIIHIGAFGNVKLAVLRKDKTKKFALKAMKKQDII